MSTQINGLTPQNTIPTGLDIQQALAVLIQQSTQTNQHLQSLAGEMVSLNQHLRNPGPLPAASQPVVAQVVEDERGGQFHQGSLCSRIGIGKTKMTEKWKVNFYVRGQGLLGRPASAYGWEAGEYFSLIELLLPVWAEISDDHFSDEVYYAKTAEVKKVNPKGFYEARYSLPPFKVDWYITAPNENKKTWAYVEQVYPCEPAQATPQPA